MANSEKILYLLGAGASAKVLPLARSVDDTNGNLLTPGLAHALRGINFNALFPREENNLKHFLLEVQKRFEDLATNADLFGDVDTFAKFLYIKGKHQELTDLKKTLTQYFIIAQLLNELKDSRYLSWLIGIMEKPTFPDDVKILSWNYDFQVQLASINFGQLEDIKHSGSGYSYGQSYIRHYPHLDPFPNNEPLSLIHLNGIAGYKAPQDAHAVSVFQNTYLSSFDKIYDFLKDIENPLIQFAWEKSGNLQKKIDLINQMIDNTTILVVIGYSFPFYNRETDKKIFEKLKGDGKLKKIYYQDPVLDGKELISKFDLRESLEIVHISNVSVFHIPFEY
jgi:hypothetical protein